MNSDDFIQKISLLELNEGDTLFIKIARGTPATEISHLDDFLKSRKCFTLFYDEQIESFTIVRNSKKE